MSKPANPTCATCKHERIRGLPFLPFVRSQYCGHPLALDRVTGRADTPCALMRGSPAGRGDPKALCGAQGRNWEAREPVLTPASAPRYWGDAALLGVKMHNAQDAAQKEYSASLVEAVKESMDRDRVDPVTAIVQRMKPR